MAIAMGACVVGSIAQRSGWPELGRGVSRKLPLSATCTVRIIQPRASLHPLIESLARPRVGALSAISVRVL